MGVSSLIRWGGPAAVLGSLLVVFGDFLSANNWMYPPAWGAGSAFMVVAITGVYLHLRRSGRIGLSGTVGFYVSIFAFMVITICSLGVLLNLWEARWYATLEAVDPLIFLGTVLFGVAILRSGRLPTGGAWLIIAFVLAKVGVIVAMAASGYTLRWPKRLGTYLKRPSTRPSTPWTGGCHKRRAKMKTLARLPS
jgi:hypothetical protein